MHKVSIAQINRFLRGEAATLALLAMALIAQTPHTATLFHRLAPTSGDWLTNFAAWSHAAAYAVALEFATLVFVVRGQKRLAWLFAFASVLVNAGYYYRADLSLADGLRAALICLALPASIAFYSHNVAEADKEEEASATPELQTKQVMQTLPPEESPGLQADLALKAMQQQEAEDASQGELILHDDRLHDLEQRVEQMVSEGLEPKWIATQGLPEIAGSQLATLLKVNASTISRWRKEARKEPAQ